MNLIRNAIIDLMSGKRKANAALKMIGIDGGAGSGNFGHAGRPGKRGGSAKRGGGGGVSKERAKEIHQDRQNFKKLSRGDKIKALKKVGQFPDNNSLFDENVAEEYAKKHGMSVDKWLDWRAARYFTMRKFQPEIVYKTPLKKSVPQMNYINGSDGKRKYIKEHTGASDDVVDKMYESITAHFGSSNADCEWTDKFIDADGRYEGAIYRWKGYGGDRAKEIVAGLVPGAKVQNKYESNWSFSSDPWKTSHFGDYNSNYPPDYVTIRYTCENNITGVPGKCLSGFSDGEDEVVPHSKTSWTITSVEKMEMPNGGTMYDVHMVEDDWHEEKGIPVWKPTGHEADGGWKEKFPKTDSGASNVYEEVKENAKKSGSFDDMDEFMVKCPAGTQFYMYDGENYGCLRKMDSDKWEYADITKKMNDNINAWLDSGHIDYHDDWSEHDSDLWNKCEKAGLTKKVSWLKATKVLMNDGTSFMEVGGKIDYSTSTKEEINNVLKEIKDGTFDGDVKDLTSGLPVGCELFEKTHGYTLKKREDGNWDFINAKGEQITDYDAELIEKWLKAGMYDWGLKESGSQEQNYKSPMEQMQDFNDHNVYGGVDNKLMEFHENGDEEACKKWVNGLPEGTIINREDGGFFEKDSNGKWTWGLNGEFFNVDDGLVAYSLVQPQIDWGLDYLPVVIPDNVIDADKVFKGVKSYKAGQMDEVAEKLPDGSMVMDVEGGYVYCKNDGKWEALNYEFDAPNFDPEKDWETYRGDAITNLDQESIPKKFKGDGTFVLKLGKKK